MKKHSDINRLVMYANVGEQIKLRREASGLNLEQLAAIVKTNSGTLLRIEKGDQAIPLHLLVSLAHEFDCTLDDLVPV